MRPFPNEYPISLGYRVPDSVSHTHHLAGFHTGIDIKVPVGTPFHAPHQGTVVTSSYDANGYGNYVVIEGRTLFGTRRWLMAHMSERMVSVGQTVKRGDVVGLSGETGNVTGAHGHIEQRHSPFTYWDHENPTIALRSFRT